MISNLILNSLIKVQSLKFCWINLRFEIVRYITILLVVMVLYYTGGLIPDLIVISINEVYVNLQTAVNIVLIAAITKLGFDCTRKLITFFGINSLVTKEVEVEVIENKEDWHDPLINYVDAEKGVDQNDT